MTRGLEGQPTLHASAAALLRASRARRRRFGWYVFALGAYSLLLFALFLKPSETHWAWMPTSSGNDVVGSSKIVAWILAALTLASIVALLVARGWDRVEVARLRARTREPRSRGSDTIRKMVTELATAMSMNDRIEIRLENEVEHP